MRSAVPLLLAALAAALAGCASMAGLAPSAHRREAHDLAAARSLRDVPVSPATWPKADWWRSLGDAQLDGLIDEALRGNPGLEAADARSRAALAEAGAAEAARQPTLNLGASSSGIRIPQSVVEPPLGGHYGALNSLSLKFSYTFDLWGGERAAWEAAVDRAHAAEVDARAARLTLAANVARTYAQLGHAHEQAELAASELARAERLLELTRQRVQAGLDSAMQLHQAEAAVPAARQQRQAAELDVETTRTALAALLGAGPDRGLDIAHPQLLPPGALSLPSTLPADLLGRRPDLVAARWRVEAAARSIDVAKTRFYPNINLGAGIGLASMGLGNFLKAESRYYQFAPALSLPIFDGGRLRANLASSDAQYDLAVAQYNQILVESLRDVATALATLRSLDVQLGAAEDAERSAAAAHELALTRYHGGVGSYLETLGAQQQRLAAEQRSSALRAERIDAAIQLVTALGGGFVPDADTPIAETDSLPSSSPSSQAPAATPAPTPAS